jgi:hypothetical protein
VASRRTPRTKSPDVSAFTPSSPWPNIEAFIAVGGSVSIGRISPIPCAAVASDDHNMLAALVRGKDESFMDLMHRLDAAIAKAEDQGEFTDEINARQPSRR